MQSKEDKHLLHLSRIHEEKRHAAKAHTAAYVRIHCLKKVHNQIHLKELYLVKQGLHKLETKEAKTGSSPTGEQPAYTLVVDLSSPLVASLSRVHQLLLTGGFAFDFSLSLLPDLLFYDTP